MPAVPQIVDYSIVLERMSGLKLRSLYYNSGSFGFDADESTQSIGWIGPADPTIKAAARNFIRLVPEPYAENLAKLLVRAWAQILPGKIWIMPASHWAYELDFGSRDWMPAALQEIGIDSELLRERTNAAAIEFLPEESPMAESFVAGLLEMLKQSDFAIAFPDHRVTCLLHHHKQLWWTSADSAVMDRLAIP
jgi:hypothetical protein